MKALNTQYYRWKELCAILMMYSIDGDTVIDQGQTISRDFIILNSKITQYFTWSITINL